MCCLENIELGNEIAARQMQRPIASSCPIIRYYVMVGEDQGALPECAKSGGCENCAKAAFGDTLCSASKWDAHRGTKAKDLASITGVRVSLVGDEKEIGEQIIIKPWRSLGAWLEKCKTCAAVRFEDRVAETSGRRDPNACTPRVFRQQRA